MLKERILILVVTVIFGAALSIQSQIFEFPEIPPSVLPELSGQEGTSNDPMQSRLFKTTELRQQINLAGFWSFITEPENTGEDNNYHTNFPNAESQMWVPGTWNSVPRYWQYQNPAWYKREVLVPEKGNLRIRFGAVFYKSKVWFDGRLLGENEGGYLPFSFVVPDVDPGTHSLVVRVDNSLDEESLPKDGTDWFPFGGIYRPVYAEIVAESFIDNFHMILSDLSNTKAEFVVKVYLKRLREGVSNKLLSLFIDGKQYYSQQHELSGDSSVVSFNITIKDPKFWSPESPILYQARLILGAHEDDQYTRFGINEFSSDGYKIFLNGKRFKLMGANHHDDHPDWGSALPPHLIRQDIEIYKRMRANAARGHYPPSEMFMDFCDQYGIVFMNEVPSWQYRPDQMANPVVKEKIKNQYYGMVYRDINHPSVFCWSLGNEWRDFQKSYADIKELVEYARTVDRTHFLTFITGGAHVDSSAQLIDLICTNWSVYQWYWDPSFRDEDSDDRVVATALDENVAQASINRLKNLHKKIPDKPIILSEFGGSGSQAGWHNWGNVKWSEEYQAKNVWESGQFGLETEWLSGGCVWQFCDTRTTPRRMLGPRLRGWNVKGVVDSYRQPKMAFYQLQELFHIFQQKNQM